MWEYRTDGTHALERGTLHISVEDGRLVGRIKDRWRGKIEAPIRLHGSHMELNLDRVRITGRLQRGRYEAYVHREFFSVAEQSARRPSRGYFIAQRVRSQSALGNFPDAGCTSLLRESSYVCSTFQSQ